MHTSPVRTAAIVATHAGLLLLALAGGASAAAAVTIPSQPPAGMRELRRVAQPAVPLRGYGALAADFVLYQGASGDRCSLLVMQCDGEEKAGIVHAKYLSDLHALGPLNTKSVPVAGLTVPVVVVPGQGAVAAFRQRAQVCVVAGTDVASLVQLLVAQPGALDGAEFVPRGEVPTYLDKFDRWGFGFWCQSPLKTPEKQEATYDVREKFEWAKKLGVGLQIDVGLNQTISAAGILQDTSKRWAIDLARDLGIPTTIQMQGSPAPNWIANRYGDELQRKVPHYVGGWYGVNGNGQFSGSPYNQLSWASVAGKDQLFADLCQSVRKYKGYPNVMGYGEWHGEISEGPVAMMLDYGPRADARFQDYLRKTYRSVQAVDQRWSGGKGVIKNWADVRMPEPAEFLGWGPLAVDLRGEWRLCLEEKLPAAAKERWGAPDLNDADWRRLVAPGDDRQIVHEKWRVPTVFRRSFTLSADQMTNLKASGKTYLYVWTLQQGFRTSVRACLNGKPLPDQPQNAWASWVVFDVGDVVTPGSNHLALSLPWGELSYRIYLSPEAPRCYPDLGPERNAQWVDYRDFISWMREDGLRRSLEAIRRDDPDKFIKLYAPGAIPDIVKGLAEDYGCYVHDTGGMSGNWSDVLPSLMRSSGMPMSLEPGNPGYELPSLKTMFGHWMTEGLQAVDYFMDIGDILWRPDQKAWFEARQPLVHLFGKFHYPVAEVAVMKGARSQRLTGFPWDGFDTPLLWYWRNTGVNTLGRMPNPRDLITERDFFRGTVDKYKVIVDDATLVMDEDLVAKIEAWVRAGGIFVVQGQGGRHTSTVMDAWPISRLTGYRVVGFNDNWRVGPAPGQTMFSDPAWNQKDARGAPAVGAAGVLLEKVAPDCEDILLWPDQSVAAGVRPLGKGKVITLGAAMPNVETGWAELLTWCDLAPPAVPVAPGCRTARFVSNNGLYDVYVIWAQKVTEPGVITLTVPGSQTTLRDIMTGATRTGIARNGRVEFAGLKVEPLEAYAFLAPRSVVPTAPLDWLTLQREWWKGTKQPAPAPAVRPWLNTLSLDADWAFRPVPPGMTNVESMTAADVDDAAWDRLDIGVWYGQKYPDTTRGVFRKRFTIPHGWRREGRTWFWLRGQSPGYPTLPPHKLQVFLDGQALTGGEHGYRREDITERLTPGEHTLVLATETRSVIGGIVGNVWLEHIPEPRSRQSLAGDWNGLQLPGRAPMPFDQIRRTFTPDPALKGRRVLLYLETTENIIPSVYLNGRLLNRDFAGMHALQDLTPYLRWDGPNMITLNSLYPGQATAVKTVELRSYDGNQL